MTGKLLVESPSSFEYHIYTFIVILKKTFRNIYKIISLKYQRTILKEGIHHWLGALYVIMYENTILVYGQCENKE